MPFNNNNSNILEREYRIIINNIHTNLEEMGTTNLTISKYNFNKDLTKDFFSRLNDDILNLNPKSDLDLLNRLQNNFIGNLFKKFTHTQLKVDSEINFKDINIYEKEKYSSFLTFTSTKPKNIDDNHIIKIKENITVNNKIKDQFLRYDTHVTLKTDKDFNTPLIEDIGLNLNEYNNFSFLNESSYQENIFNQDFFSKIKTIIYNGYFEKCMKTYANYKDCAHHAYIYSDTYMYNYITKIEPIVSELYTLTILK